MIKDIEIIIQPHLIDLSKSLASVNLMKSLASMSFTRKYYRYPPFQFFQVENKMIAFS
uniref:Uncharacterized protein n=1 Tax=Arion vulgaris TaxID=1028688 RepID=A0A0B6YWK0_9EUPU